MSAAADEAPADILKRLGALLQDHERRIVRVDTHCTEMASETKAELKAVQRQLQVLIENRPAPVAPSHAEFPVELAPGVRHRTTNSQELTKF